MKLLFVGDVVGDVGRHALETVLPRLRERHEPDFVVVNGENAAGGLGITEKIARGFLDGLGVDAITLGNHAYRHASVFPFLDADLRIVRPANYFRGDPGRGHTVVARDGRRLAVVNLSGTVFLDAARSPFSEADAVIAALDGECDFTLVDFHAEATSEKVAMGWYLDGRVAAVLGTHTHVPTADGRVLPGGTAFISDVGMTGSRRSVLGVKREQAIERFRTGMPVRFETADEDVWINAALVEVGADGMATGFEQLLLPADGTD
ncbi:MAG: TIGR00282 family metallophosphoesterase [Thermoleophilaceae bacterium]|nr:TIGR00282 family metallophosphoesterase [Thermoleophilaceae bacterium]